MKRVLVAGAGGMTGHMMYHYLNSTGKYEMRATARDRIDGIEYLYADIEKNIDAFKDIVRSVAPNVIINCIGVLVKPSNENPTRAIIGNSLFPHILEDLCREIDAKLIHISTDCVFDGKNGPYDESSVPTETNWYGRTKALGEIINGKDLTLRTSIIGPELKKNGSGLFEWFMRQTGTVTGYIDVRWNGITTLELAKQVDRILDTDLTGLYHLTPNAHVSKGKLLKDIQDIWGKMDVEIEMVCSKDPRSKILINNRIQEYDPMIPDYQTQLIELRDFMRPAPCNGI